MRLVLSSGAAVWFRFGAGIGTTWDVGGQGWRGGGGGSSNRIGRGAARRASPTRPGAQQPRPHLLPPEPPRPARRAPPVLDWFLTWHLTWLLIFSFCHPRTRAGEADPREPAPTSFAGNQKPVLHPRATTGAAAAAARTTRSRPQRPVVGGAPAGFVLGFWTWHLSLSWSLSYGCGRCQSGCMARFHAICCAIRAARAAARSVSAVTAYRLFSFQAGLVKFKEP